MLFTKRKPNFSICPKTGKPMQPDQSTKKEHSKYSWVRWIFPVIGLLSLVWFLIRVLPKPSRAAYPCQRVAMPLASGFVVWLLGAIGSAVAYKKAKQRLYQCRYLAAAACIIVSILMLWLPLSITDSKPTLAQLPPPNSPMGEAKGIHPGRVVWIHDPNATDWEGVGNGHWWESDHTNQQVVDKMLARAIRGLTGEPTVAAAWDALFRHFNQSQGKGDVGYQPGEKIMIKVNLVGCIAWYEPWDSVDDTTWNMFWNYDYMNTSPQMMLALLKQLVNEVGVNQEDISIGDTLCNFPNEYYNMLHPMFPNVHYLDYEADDPDCEGRTAINKNSGVYIFWSGPDQSGNSKYEQVPTCYTDAEYVINMANLKSHDSNAGVTLCGKNHYGSLCRGPTNLSPQSGYYDLHESLPAAVSGIGHYRALVDLMGHSHIGGKTVLYLIDGLYAGRHPYDHQPTKWQNCPPYDEIGPDWTSCIFASQDPVAIDSVGLDFLWAEWGSFMSGTTDYLSEAAEANDPLSGTFYDPDHYGNVTRLDSLGVFEHWNNETDKQYSRNLGTGDGIELIRGYSDIENNEYGLDAVASNWLRDDCGNENNWCDGADIDFSSTVNMIDFVSFAQHWLDD